MVKNFKGAIRLELELELRDKDGKLISARRLHSKSLLRNFIKLLRDYMISKTNVGGSSVVSLYPPPAGNVITMATVKNLSNVDTALQTARSPYSAGASYTLSYFGVDALAGIDAFGLVVGWGTVAVTPSDYNLANKFAEGSGSGQLTYGAVTVEEVAIVDTMITRFRVIRTFTNNYTAPQTVNEIGLIVCYRDRYYIAAVGEQIPTLYSLLARDVLTPGQTIPIGATLTVRYIFSGTA